ncbi:MAG: thiolase family protein [Pseudomonadota bacterium]
MEKKIVIVSAARTPFGRFGGSLKDFDYYDLGAIPMKEVMTRVGLKPESGIVDEVFWGTGDTAQCKEVYTPVAARQTLLKAGLPATTPSISFDKACVSAMSAVKLAATAIRAGDIDTAIAGGCTTFSREPLILRNVRFNGFRYGNVTMEDPCFALGYKDYNPVSVDSDNIAFEYGISRQEQDEWAARSHDLYGKAWNAGKFKEEIIPIDITQQSGQTKVLDIDEQYRPGTTAESLSRLKTIFNTRCITAGNAPGLNDGATAILVMSKEKAQELKIPILAEVVAQVSIAISPLRMPEGPGFAMQAVLKKANLKIEDMACMEINEAFACVPLVSMRVFSGTEAKILNSLKERMNINGSAIATGHPNTASGARLIMNLMYELRRRGGGYSMGAICGGLGQTDATIIKVG